MLHPLNFNTWLFDSLQKLKHYELIIKPAVIFAEVQSLRFPARRGGVSLLLPPSPFSKPTYLNETGLHKRISRQTRTSSVTAVSNATEVEKK